MKEKYQRVVQRVSSRRCNSANHFIRVFLFEFILFKEFLILFAFVLLVFPLLWRIGCLFDDYKLSRLFGNFSYRNGAFGFR